LINKSSISGEWYRLMWASCWTNLSFVINGIISKCFVYLLFDICDTVMSC
jgi:hypothetical protein